VWAPSIPASFQDYPTIVSGATVDMTPRTGFDRAGWIELVYQPGVAPTSSMREIRFPYYAGGGHSVSMRAPGPLLADVMQWYAQTPTASAAHLPPSSAGVASALRPPATPVATTPQSRPFLGP
jgi:hypothetical protein